MTLPDADPTAEDPPLAGGAGRERLRQLGRAAMGVTGTDERPPPLREVIRTSGVGWYPLLAVCVLVIVDEFQRTAFLVLGPEISQALGLSRQSVGLLLSLSLLMVSLAALPMAALVQRTARRAALSVATAVVWSVTTIASGFIRTPAALGGMLLADGASTGSVQALHQPLLFDTYPPEARVRVLSAYRAADFLGRILAPALVAVTTGVFLLTWRGVFLVMGVISVLAALFAARLRDPGFGRWDTDRFRHELASAPTATIDLDADDDVALGYFEIVRRLFLIPTVRRIFVAFALLGMMLTPLITFFAFYLEDAFRLGPAGRGVFSATTPILSLVALGVAGRSMERLFRRDPGDLMRTCAVLFAVSIVFLFLAVLSPVLVGTWLGFAAFSALYAVINPAMSAALQGIIPPRMRPHATALTGVFLFGVGGPVGLVLLGGIDKRIGLAGALLVLAVPAALAMLVLHRAGRTIGDDLDRMVDELIDEQELRELTTSGAHVPLLSCSRIDFAYDQLQVLFDVSFTVDEGEMVTLLGTNGAGKSTLLRVISGLGLPSRGSVRYRGADITYLDPQRRVASGISQIPGGKAVFPRLSVVENLRAYGFSLGRDTKTLERGIEATFDAFPRLHERRNAMAGTLSGGEAQMLALGKALLLRPRLLLIDELSLGLAPKIVGELLELVRQINEDGTAVVLVEQSVNIALSLADHAYFMEKGEIRFDGAAADLLGRDDLLRSVFLKGATVAGEQPVGT